MSATKLDCDNSYPSTSQQPESENSHPSTSQQPESENSHQSTSEQPESEVEPQCTEQVIKTEVKAKPKYFQCEVCALHELYDYFGNDPPFVKQYKLLENAYVIEDPFVPPKQSEFIVLGAHCICCNKSVCKDTNCSMYYDGTYCIFCAKSHINMFPANVQEKLKRIITQY